MSWTNGDTGGERGYDGTPCAGRRTLGGLSADRTDRDRSAHWAGARVDDYLDILGGEPYLGGGYGSAVCDVGTRQWPAVGTDRCRVRAGPLRVPRGSSAKRDVPVAVTR
jgi:hypothetical protein